MSIQLEAKDMAGGYPAVKFENVGDSVEGTILGARKVQQRDFNTGIPSTWDNGDPKWEYQFDLDVDSVPHTLYARNQMWGVIREAIKETSPGGLPEEGGTLKVKFTELGEAKKAGFHPPKLYLAKYTPPTQVSIDASDFDI
jgi:hypothetical protein